MRRSRIALRAPALALPPAATTRPVPNGLAGATIAVLTFTGARS
jgi:hypothetical protein